MIEFLSQYNIVVLGVLFSLAAGLFTGFGALLIYVTNNVSKKFLDASLGIAAGVMLAATSFSLIIPAIEKGGGGSKGSLITLTGMLIGGLFIVLSDRLFPNSNLMLNSLGGNDAAANERLRKIWLFIIAITIHNFPEGLAVGVGFGDGDISNGVSIAIGIGLQNFPEGLAVAIPLIRERYPKWKALLIAICTGLVEPLGGLLGVGLVQIFRPVLPFALSFAAGAMLFVISHEIIPETQSDHQHSKMATVALLIGFVVMMFLDNSIG